MESHQRRVQPRSTIQSAFCGRCSKLELKSARATTIRRNQSSEQANAQNTWFCRSRGNSSDSETGTKNWSVRRVPMIPDMRRLLEQLRVERTAEPANNLVMRVRECQKAM